MTILLGDSIPLTPWLRQLLFMWARFARPNVERRGLGEPLGSPEERRRIKKYDIYDLFLQVFVFTQSLMPFVSSSSLDDLLDKEILF